MPDVVFIVPGDIDTRTGGYIYDKRVAAGLRALGWSVEIRPPDLADVADGAITLIDGLALLSIRDDIARHGSRLRLVPLIHLPLALEAGLDREEAARRDAWEAEALGHARMAIATGRRTADQLVARGLARDRVALVPPGTDAAPLARGSHGDRVALVMVAALTSGKGHERLLRALALVPSPAWTLTCAGSTHRDPPTTSRVRGLIAELGFEDRVTLVGELDAEPLAALYDRSEAFVFASAYETFGMAVAEAIARGLPVVGTDVGAAREIVGAGGILVPPGQGALLADALARVITDADSRARLGERARAARTRLGSWEDASRAMADALMRVHADV